MNNTMQKSEIATNPLAALESVRAMLSIAIATHSHTTSPEQRKNYMETADRMRRCLRRLRHVDEPRLSPRGMFLLQEAFQEDAGDTNAERICHIVHSLMTELENETGV